MHVRIKLAFAAGDREGHLGRHRQVSLGKGVQRVIGRGHFQPALRCAFADHHRKMRLACVDRRLPQQGDVFGHQLLCQMGPEPLCGGQLTRGLQQQPGFEQGRAGERGCSPVLGRGRARQLFVEGNAATLSGQQPVEGCLILRPHGIGLGSPFGIAHRLQRAALPIACAALADRGFHGVVVVLEMAQCGCWVVQEAQGDIA